MSIETQLCELMQYSDAILFPKARDALDAWCQITNKKIKIPTNCCSALLPFASELVPINPETGLAPIPVQLYGYRQEFPGSKIEIDPLMTGLFGMPFADSTIISFGYGKTIDIGGGGAILTQNVILANELREFAFFPKVLCSPLESALDSIHSIIMEKKRQYEKAENKWFSYIDRLPTRPIIPWRLVAKKNERTDASVDYFRSYDWRISNNYPPLPGVTDKGAIEWGEKVINIWI